MRIIFFIGLILLTTISSFGQPRFRKVLIIDTLAGQLDNFIVAVSGPTDKPAVVPDEFVYRPKDIQKNRYSNLQTVVTTDSINAMIILSLDDAGGVLELKNAFNLKADTVRINKLTVYKNCLPDSAVKYTSCFKHYQDGRDSSLVELCCKQRFYRVGKPCDISYPAYLNLTINNTLYFLLLENRRWPYGGLVEHGHGSGHGHGTKKMGRRKWKRISKKYYKREKAGKPYISFSYEKLTTSNVLFAELVLK